MSDKAWAVFSVDLNGEDEMLECFSASDGFSRADAEERADEVRGEEARLFNNAVAVRAGTMEETGDGPLFVEGR